MKLPEIYISSYHPSLISTIKKSNWIIALLSYLTGNMDILWFTSRWVAAHELFLILGVFDF